MLKGFVVLVCLGIAFGDGVYTNSSSSVQNPTPTLGPSRTMVPSAQTSTIPPHPATQTPMSSTVHPSPTGSMPTATAVPTTNKPKTTGKPTAPLPSYATYAVKKNGSYCLLAELEAKFTIHYMVGGNQNTSNSTNGTVPKPERKVATIFINRTTPVNTNTSNCGKLVLEWPMDKDRPYYTLGIEFATVKALGASNESHWQLKSVSLDVILRENPEFRNATVEMINSIYNATGAATISNKVGNYYYCKDNPELTLKTHIANYSVEADFTYWKFEPFVKQNNTKFSSDGVECYQDHPTSTTLPTKKKDNNDIVPIAVGCALAGLVLIVLIAYVIGRRKSHRGYEKV